MSDQTHSYQIFTAGDSSYNFAMRKEYGLHQWHTYGDYTGSSLKWTILNLLNFTIIAGTSTLSTHKVIQRGKILPE